MNFVYFTLSLHATTYFLSIQIDLFVFVCVLHEVILFVFHLTLYYVLHSVTLSLCHSVTLSLSGYIVQCCMRLYRLLKRKSAKWNRNDTNICYGIFSFVCFLHDVCVTITFIYLYLSIKRTLTRFLSITGTLNHFENQN